jgi:hypothetical protein
MIAARNLLSLICKVHILAKIYVTHLINLEGEGGLQPLSIVCPDGARWGFDFIKSLMPHPWGRVYLSNPWPL